MVTETIGNLYRYRGSHTTSMQHKTEKNRHATATKGIVVTINGIEIEPEAIEEILEEWNKTYATPLKSLSQLVKATKHKMRYLRARAKLSPFKTVSKKTTKPIIWGIEHYSEELSFKFEENSEKNLFQIRCYFRNEVQLGVWFGDSKESTVSKAQKWLNGFVSGCAAKSDAILEETREIEPKTCDCCWLGRDFGKYIPAGYCADRCAKIYNALKDV